MKMIDCANVHQKSTDIVQKGNSLFTSRQRIVDGRFGSYRTAVDVGDVAEDSCSGSQEVAGC